MDLRTKRRWRKRAASVGAVLGATALAACASTEGEAPPIDYDASPDGTSPVDSGRDAHGGGTDGGTDGATAPVDSGRDASPPFDSGRDALTDSTLVDLDSEADGPFLDADAGDAGDTGDAFGQRDGGAPDAEVS